MQARGSDYKQPTRKIASSMKLHAPAVSPPLDGRLDKGKKIPKGQ